MYLKKEQKPIILTNIIILALYSVYFVISKNYEFLMYVGVIILLLFAVLYSNKKVDYPAGILWGLTLWNILHMSGGGLYLGGEKLYELMIIQLVGEPYHILKFDQVVHFIGFWIATLVMYHILKPSIKPGKKRWVSLSIVIVMAGLGLGALNEIIEFSTTIFLADTGVGGYENTGLDLVSNLLGAIGALIYIRHSEKKAS